MLGITSPQRNEGLGAGTPDGGDNPLALPAHAGHGEDSSDQAFGGDEQAPIKKENLDFNIDPSLNAAMVKLNDFALLKVIGKGSFGKVMLVKKHGEEKIYAMKVLEKENIIRRNQVEHTRTERNILGVVKHPFIVQMKYAFQTTKKLYFVLEYCPGGELFFHLGRAGRFSEGRARFYTAQIVLALEYLHQQGVIYRDLKPENVLLDDLGNIKLTDFGLSKTGINDNVSATSFCGTPEYLAPEILTRSGHGWAADWWSLGALVYEMLTGMPPFYSRSRERLFTKILKCNPRIPSSLSAEAQNFIMSLLEREMNKRLGSTGDAVEVKAHPFFKGVDWDAIYHKRLAAPFRPRITNILDTANFENEFTKIPVDDEAQRRASRASASSLSTDVAEGKFTGFTYEKSPSNMSLAAVRQEDMMEDDVGRDMGRLSLKKQ